jgi:hypothetical protein
MSRIAGSTLTMCLLMIGMLSAAVAQQTAALPPMTVSISGPQSVKSGDPIEVYVTVSNNTVHDVQVGSSVSSRNAEMINRIDVIGPAGLPPPETEYGLEVHGKKDGTGNTGSMKSITIGSDDQLTQSSIVSKIYDMTKPGKYLIQAQRYLPDGTTVITSNRIIVIVTN